MDEEEKKELEKEKKDKEKERHGKLSGFFYNLAQLTYTALVLGACILYFQEGEVTLKLFGMMAFGIVLSALWALAGNKTLNY